MKNTTWVYCVLSFLVGILVMTLYFGANSSSKQNETTHHMDEAMEGMTSSLNGKTGDAFDKAFLSEMIIHHEGAVTMAQAVLKTSKRPELIKLAKDIISAQTTEIQMMKSWEKGWFNIGQ